MDLWKERRRGTFVGPLCAAAAATDVTRNGRKRRAEVRNKWRGRRERERERGRGRTRGEELGFQGEHTATPTES